jgi:hypothetical protein
MSNPDAQVAPTGEYLCRVFQSAQYALDCNPTLPDHFSVLASGSIISLCTSKAFTMQSLEEGEILGSATMAMGQRPSQFRA